LSAYDVAPQRVRAATRRAVKVAEATLLLLLLLLLLGDAYAMAAKQPLSSSTPMHLQAIMPVVQ